MTDPAGDAEDDPTQQAVGLIVGLIVRLIVRLIVESSQRALVETTLPVLFVGSQPQGCDPTNRTGAPDRTRPGPVGGARGS